MLTAAISIDIRALMAKISVSVLEFCCYGAGADCRDELPSSVTSQLTGELYLEIYLPAARDEIN